MGASVFSVYGIVDVLTGKAEKKLGDIDKKAELAGKSLGDASVMAEKFGTAMMEFGKIAAVLAPFVAMTAMAARFEQQMRNVNSILKMSEGDFAVTSDGIRKMTAEMGTAVGPTEAAAAMYDIASSGFTDAASATDVLKASMVAATAGMTDAKTAAGAITAVMNAYGQGAMSAAEVSDKLFKVVEIGVTTFPELSQHMGSTLAIASAAGISFDELSASVAVLTTRGMKTDIAFTAMKSAIAKLMAPTQMQKDAMAEYGLEIDENTLKQKGLVGVLQEITIATGGSKDAMMRIIGDIQGVTGAMSLMSDGGDAAVSAIKQVGRAGGSSLASMNEQNKAAANQWTIFKAQAEAAGVGLLNTTLPAINGVLQGLNGLLSWFNSFPSSVTGAIGTMAAVAAGVWTINKAFTMAKMMGMAFAATQAFLATSLGATAGAEVAAGVASVGLATTLGATAVAEGTATVTTAALTTSLAASLAGMAGAGVASTALGISLTAMAGEELAATVTSTGLTTSLVATAGAEGAVAVASTGMAVSVGEAAVAEEVATVATWGWNTALLGTVASIGLLVAAGAVAIAAALEWVKITEEQIKAQNDLIEVENRRAVLLGQGKGMIGKTEAEIRKMGITSQEATEKISAAIIGLQEVIESRKKEGLDFSEQEAEVNRLRALKSKFAEEGTAIVAKEKTEKEQTIKANAKAAQETVKIWEDFKKTREAGIYATKTQELAALDEVTSHLKKGTPAWKEAQQERVRLLRESAQEQRQMAVEAVAAEAKVAGVRVDTAKLALAQAEAAGDATIANHQAVAAAGISAADQEKAAALAALQAKIDKAKEGGALTVDQDRAFAAERTAIEGDHANKVGAIRQELADKEKARHLLMLQSTREVATLEVEAANTRMRVLDVQRSQGMDVEAEYRAAVQERLRLTMEGHNAEVQAALASAKSGEERAAIIRKSVLEERNIKANAEAEEMARRQQLDQRKIDQERSMQIEIVRITKGDTFAKAMERAKQVEDARKAGASVAQIAAWTAAKEQEQIKAVTDARRSMQKEILETLGRSRESAVMDIEDRVAAARQAGVDEATIAQWVAAKKMDLLKKEKGAVDDLNAAKQTGFGSGPMSLEEMAKSMSDNLFGKTSEQPGVGGAPAAGDLTDSQVESRLGSLGVGKGEIKTTTQIDTTRAAGDAAAKATIAGGGAATVAPAGGAAVAGGGKAEAAAGALVGGSPSLVSNVAGGAAPGGAGAKIEMGPQIVEIRFNVDGKVEVAKGPLSQKTAEGVVGDIGLEARILGDRPNRLGRT